MAYQMCIVIAAMAMTIFALRQVSMQENLTLTRRLDKMALTLADVDTAISQLVANEATLQGALNQTATDLQAALSALNAKIASGSTDFTTEVTAIQTAASNLTNMATQVGTADATAKTVEG